MRKKSKSKKPRQYVVKHWYNRLYGYPCFILGNSPSILQYDLSSLKNYFTIGINRIYKLFDPSILIWQDETFLETERVDHLKAIKFCRDTLDPEFKYYHFYRRGDAFSFVKTTHILNGTGNTGILAVQLAHSLGCFPLVLLGMDCRVDSKTNFYGNNPFWNEYTLSYCKEALKFIQENCPVEVILCKSQEKLSELLGGSCPLKREIGQRLLGVS